MDFFTANDKLCHLLVSYFLAAFFYTLLRCNFRSKLFSAFLAIGAALAIGYLKEYTDYQFDQDDLRADMFGAFSFPLLFAGSWFQTRREYGRR